MNKPISLGRHRLMLGDSTDSEQVRTLMGGVRADLFLVDPPYGVSYVGKTKDALVIKNDHLSLQDVAKVWRSIAKNAHESCKDVSSYLWFACQGGDQMMMMMMMLGEAGWKVRHELIWVKDRFVLSRCDYHYAHEPILYGWKQKGTHKYYGDRKQRSTLFYNRPKRSALHPTMKPIELVEYLIKNHTKEGDIVLDLCGGSGTTLLACENTNRTCYMMEIDPMYYQVIQDRWKNYSPQSSSSSTSAPPESMDGQEILDI